MLAAAAPNAAAACSFCDPSVQPILELIDVSKRYGGVRALEHARFACASGRIHALLGENGAGKSTLIKIMAGVVQPDEGRIVLQGQERRFLHPQDAVNAGIACIFQELSLMPDLSVADNICITNPPRRFGLIDQRAQRRIAEAALARAGAEGIHPLAPVGSLSLSRRQMVEIAKALAREPKILILDEATSALTAADVQRVFALLKRLRNEGLAIVYISHRMHEIAELADDCSVFRNGQHVATFEAGTRSDAETVQMMIGREISHAFPPKTPAMDQAPAATSAAAAPPRLEVRALSWNDRLHDISLSAREGEVVGIGGLDGQGQREFFFALFGVLRGVSGEIRVDGQAVKPASPRAAKRAGSGIALVPEDRKTDGLMLPMAVRENLSLAALDALCRGGVIDRARESQAADRVVKQLSIKAPDLDDAVGTLSGGNQQKVVIAKWLLNAPRIILLSDPTRGIDVGTKQEMYALLRQLAAAGTTVLLYSTDYAELIGCCDRVAVFFDGRIVRWLQGDQLTEHALVSSALNIEVAA